MGFSRNKEKANLQEHDVHGGRDILRQGHMGQECYEEPEDTRVLIR